MSERRPIFREAALAAHRGGSRPGRPLHIVGTWTRWAVGVTVAVAVAGLIFVATARVGEYARGVAVVHREGRQIATSTVSGVVQSIEVAPGQRVSAGQVLVRLDDVAQQAELARLEREYEQRLVELLREPADEARRERLAALEGPRALASARVAERTVTAARDGVVSDVRVHVGQPLAPGDAVATVEQDTAETIVVGLFPGHYRPMFEREAGIRLELELAGFPDSRQEVALRSVADEVVGPVEAMRYLGRDRAGAMAPSGPVVIVVTVLPGDSFSSEGVEYRIYDGMQGTLEAELRSETLLDLLLPDLEESW